MVSWRGPVANRGEDGAGRMRQDIRAFFPVLLAGCLALDASGDVVANGEDSPGRALVAPVPLRLAQPGALDQSLRINLAPLDRQQLTLTSAPQRPGPARIGFHRGLGEYRGDLVPRLQWVESPHDGSVVASLTVTAPGAWRVRLSVFATLPPGGAIRFFDGSSFASGGRDGSGLLPVQRAGSAVVAIGPGQHHWPGTDPAFERRPGRNRIGDRPRRARLRTVESRKMRRKMPRSRVESIRTKRRRKMRRARKMPSMSVSALPSPVRTPRSRSMSRMPSPGSGSNGGTAATNAPGLS